MITATSITCSTNCTKQQLLFLGTNIGFSVFLGIGTIQSDERNAVLFRKRRHLDHLHTTLWHRRVRCEGRSKSGAAGQKRTFPCFESRPSRGQEQKPEAWTFKVTHLSFHVVREVWIFDVQRESLSAPTWCAERLPQQSRRGRRSSAAPSQGCTGLHARTGRAKT